MGNGNKTNVDGKFNKGKIGDRGFHAFRMQEGKLRDGIDGKGRGTRTNHMRTICMNGKMLEWWHIFDTSKRNAIERVDEKFGFRGNDNMTERGNGKGFTFESKR